MNLTIRHRLYVLSFLPVIIVSIAMMLEASIEARRLSSDQIASAH